MGRSTVWALVAASCICSAPTFADNVALRVKPDGVRDLTRFADAVPETIPLSPTTLTVIDCWGQNDMLANLSNIELGIDFRELEFDVSDGFLSIDAVVDATGQTTAHLQKILCVAGQTTCELSLDIQHLAVHLELAVDVSDTGELKVVGQSPMVDIENLEGVELDSTGCFLGDAVEVVTDAFGEWAVGFWSEPIGEALEGVAQNYLNDLPLGLPASMELGNFRVATNFSTAKVSLGTGLSVRGSALVSALSETETDLLEPPTEEPFENTMDSGNYQLAAGDSLVNQALDAAWSSGMLRSILSGALPTLELPSTGIVADKLGLPPGTEVSFSLEFGESPRVDFGRVGDKEIQLVIPQLSMSMTTTSPGGTPGVLEVNAGGRVSAEFQISGSGALVLRPKAISLDSFQLASGSLAASADPARVEQMLSDMAIPALTRTLKDMPLAPVLNPIENVFVWVRQMQTSGGWLRAAFDLVSPDPNDILAPETSVERVPVVRPGRVELKVHGSDDDTPDALLRFRVSVDGELVGEAPEFGETVAFIATEGTHAVEVAAIDLIGNVDPTPVVFSVEVDSEPPVLQVTESPASILYEDTVTASWSASDDRPGVHTHWRVILLDGDGNANQVVDSGAGDGSGTAVISNLSPDELYVLRITAEDEAGNVTSEEFGFSFDRGGCSHGGSGGSAVFLLGFALFLARRKAVRK